MKMCWDNLERLMYRKDRGDWQDRHTKVNFYSEEICDNCQNSFFKQQKNKSSRENFCNRNCYYEYRKNNIEKYVSNYGKRKCKCGEINKDKFYKTGSLCKKCHKLWMEKYYETERGKKVKRKSWIKSSKNKERNKKKYEKRRLYHCMSSRIRQSLKKGKGGESWPNLVGYTIEDLKKHLEGQFTSGMNWNNYGHGGWEIDHKKPIVLFDIESYENREFKECWSLDNLRPMWSSENRKRGAILGNLRRLNNV